MNCWTFPMMAALCLLAGCAARTPEQQTKHDDTHYNSALSPYVRDLKLGVSRKEVEDYLHARNIKFQRRCCTATDLISDTGNHILADAFDDWIPLREEFRPWPCGGAYVFIAFEFEGLRPYSESGHVTADERDTLEAIHIVKANDDCF